jgi:DNA-binding XRE family transcriptional regulator
VQAEPTEAERLQGIARFHERRKDSMKKHTFNLWKIKELMKEHGFNQEEMAVHLGISANQMRAKLNGKQKFWVDELLIIADLFGEHPGLFFILNVTKTATSIHSLPVQQQ